VRAVELFEKRKVALISVAESLDIGSAAGWLVITIMGTVSQWERETIGERTRDTLRHKRTSGERGRQYPVRGFASGSTGNTSNQIRSQSIRNAPETAFYAAFGRDTSAQEWFGAKSAPCCQ
jgi:DNA invertase Pin-like site-specific DNA recombinase